MENEFPPDKDNTLLNTEELWKEAKSVVPNLYHLLTNLKLISYLKILCGRVEYILSFRREACGMKTHS